jgi:hypothetical protein
MRKADNLTTFTSRLSWNLGASTSWNPRGLSSPVMGLLYIFEYCVRIENCAVLRYYAACCGNFWPKFRDKLSVPSSRVKKQKESDSRPIKMIPIGCTETSVWNYPHSLRNSSEERSSFLLHDGSLKCWIWRCVPGAGRQAGTYCLTSRRIFSGDKHIQKETWTSVNIQVLCTAGCKTAGLARSVNTKPSVRRSEPSTSCF